MPLDYCVTGDPRHPEWHKGRAIVEGIVRGLARDVGLKIGQLWISQTFRTADRWPTRSDVNNGDRVRRVRQDIHDQLAVLHPAPDEPTDTRVLLNSEFAPIIDRAPVMDGRGAYPVQACAMVAEFLGTANGWFGGARLTNTTDHHQWQQIASTHYASLVDHLVIAAHIPQNRSQTARFAQLEGLIEVVEASHWLAAKRSIIRPCIGLGLAANGAPVKRDVLLSALAECKRLGIGPIIWDEGQPQKREQLMTYLAEAEAEKKEIKP